MELSSYKNGEIDVSDNLSAEAEQTYRDKPDYYAAEKIGVRYITCNTEHITDNRIRKALAYAIDRDMLIKIEGCAHKAATGLVPYGIHWDGKQWRDVADEKNGGKLVEYDLEKAKQLLSQRRGPAHLYLHLLQYLDQPRTGPAEHVEGHRRKCGDRFL